MQNNMKIHDSSRMSWPHSSFGKFFDWDFLGYCLKPQGVFWVLNFAPIRSSLSLEIQSTTLGKHQGQHAICKTIGPAFFSANPGHFHMQTGRYFSINGLGFISITVALLSLHKSLGLLMKTRYSKVQITQYAVVLKTTIQGVRALSNCQN